MRGQSRVDETEDERLNRNLDQLLQELRVVLQGVQVLLAFLLAVPFASHFDRVDDFERDLYFAALLLSATSVLFLMAPSIQHRVLFRQHHKLYLVASGNVFAIVGIAFLALAIVAALTLVTHFLFGSRAAWMVGSVALGSFAGLWYIHPLMRRFLSSRVDRPSPRERQPEHRSAGGNAPEKTQAGSDARDAEQDPERERHGLDDAG
jgi:hypothetical protein